MGEAVCASNKTLVLNDRRVGTNPKTRPSPRSGIGRGCGRGPLTLRLVCRALWITGSPTAFERPSPSFPWLIAGTRLAKALSRRLIRGIRAGHTRVQIIRSVMNARGTRLAKALSRRLIRGTSRAHRGPDNSQRDERAAFHFLILVDAEIVLDQNDDLGVREVDVGQVFQDARGGRLYVQASTCRRRCSPAPTR